MGDKVKVNGNEITNHEQLDGKINSTSISNHIVSGTITNGTLKSHDLKDLNLIGGSTEKSSLLENQNVQTYRPLTFFRVLRGVLCLMMLISTALTTLIFFAPPAFLILRLFSIRNSRKVISFLFGHWLAMWPLWFEKINGTNVIFAGERVPARERILLLANHRTEVDWMYIWDLALRKDRLGYIKYILKSSVRNAPIFGWGFHILEFILVERKWEVDEPVIESMLSTFKDPQDPLWLILFPEGTDFTEQKCLRSQRFAEEHHLPILKNVLQPKTKGFYSCLTLLRDSLDAVYDVTIAYKHRFPLFMNIAFGTDPAEVHIHVRRVPLHEIPTSENEAAAWLVEAFRQKDELLSNFYKEGSFPNSGTEEELPNFKCFLNLLVIIGFSGLFLVLTFSSFLWIRVYVATSCVYLAAATYFNSRPKPIFGFLNRRIRGNTYISSHKDGK